MTFLLRHFLFLVLLGWQCWRTIPRSHWSTPTGWQSSETPGWDLLSTSGLLGLRTLVPISVLLMATRSHLVPSNWPYKVPGEGGGDLENIMGTKIHQRISGMEKSISFFNPPWFLALNVLTAVKYKLQTNHQRFLLDLNLNQKQSCRETFSLIKP